MQDPRKSPPQPDELRLVPLLNLVSLVVPVGLMVGWLVWSKAEQAPVPSAVAGLSLVVEIADDGYLIHGADETLRSAGLPAWIPCHSGCANPEHWDTQALGHSLLAIKRAWPAERAVSVTPQAHTPWALIERTTAAAQATTRRGEPVVLFSDVLVGSP